MFLTNYTAVLGFLLSSVAFADSTSKLQLDEGWYEGYNELFLDYKGLQINGNGNHRLLTSHLSWGMTGFRNIYFSDDDIQCSNMTCVIKIPEPDHEGHLNQLVLSPSPTDGWYVMQAAAKLSGELVLTQLYELKKNNRGSDGYAFSSRYEEALQNIKQPGDGSLDGLWIGVHSSNTAVNLVALEYEQGEAATLVRFFEGGVSEFEFPAEGITTSQHTLSLSAWQSSTEHRITLDNQNNQVLVGYVLRTLPNGTVLRNSLKLIRVQARE